MAPPRRRRCGRPPACRASSIASSSDSGSRRRRTGFSAPVPHAGRSSSRSVRVAATTSALPGPWRARAATRSIRSSICGRSSARLRRAGLTGALAREPLDQRDEPAPHIVDERGLVAARLVHPEQSDCRRSTVRRRSGRTHALSTSSRSRCTATSAGSSSSMPATSRTIAAAGANVALSAPRWLRPTSTVPSGSNPARNSAASLDLPIPGSPTSVKSSGATCRSRARTAAEHRELVGAPHEGDRPAGRSRAEPVDAVRRERLDEALRFDEPLLAEGHRPLGERAWSPRQAPRQVRRRSGAARPR